MTLPQKIDNIEKAIFDYEIANVANNVANVFSEIVGDGILDTGDPETVGKFNLLMGTCLAAMQKKDYLLLADQLEYILKPMIAGGA
jgi:hypothetical protein